MLTQASNGARISPGKRNMPLTPVTAVFDALFAGFIVTVAPETGNDPDASKTNPPEMAVA